MKELFTENSFYYFYSTVPQVLAGGIALIGAFLIFFIAESNKKMKKILEDAWNYIGTRSCYSEIEGHILKKYTNGIDNTDYIEMQYYNEIFEMIKKRFNDLDDKGFMQFYDKFKLEYDLKSNVVNGGIQAVVLSGILMAISIILLPFVQYLIKCLPFGVFITVLIIVFSCYAIYLITNVVIRAIRKL